MEIQNRSGTMVEGKYEILKQIGQGGMSKVYLAMDVRLNKQWAVKEIEKFSEDKNNEVIVQSLIAEANLMKRLDHPALPRIVDIIERETTILVVMDYIEGEPLSHLLAEEGAQPQERVIGWAKQLCQVLYYLHSCDPPIIYRDIKPSNILLQPGGNLKLIDFGIAREYKKNQVSDTTNLGTRGYAAPEQFSITMQTDARTDIYGLGATLYHLVTGIHPAEEPYDYYPIRYWNPELSGGLEHIIATCLQKDPKNRYPSCVELLYDLHHYEEVDETFRNRQKRKIKGFFSIFCISILFLILGIATTIFGTITKNNQYETKLKQAGQMASNDVERADLLLEAIQIKPESVEAYQELVETYKSDGEFSVEEETQLKKCLNSNLSYVQGEKDYPDLAFEIGKLYWHYYSYGTEQSEDNRATRIKSAAKWFEDALETGGKKFDKANLAKIYVEISNFQNQIATDIEEASDRGKYQAFWIQLEQLITENEKNPDENEMVRLELYKLVMDSMENYARKLKADGIRKMDLLTAYYKVKAQVAVTEATTEKTENLKKAITDRYAYVEEAILHAYLTTEMEEE
jgi:serine/threonine-protein kinase